LDSEIIKAILFKNLTLFYEEKSLVVSVVNFELRDPAKQNNIPYNPCNTSIAGQLM